MDSTHPLPRAPSCKTTAPFHRLCANEFLGFFYLYQFSAFSVQFWNSYFVYSSLHMTVVLISGLLSILVVWKNERVIQSLIKHDGTCMAVRDDEWQEVAHENLVPGDIIHVKSDWLLPCDCVILEVGKQCPVRARALLVLLSFLVRRLLSSARSMQCPLWFSFRISSAPPLWAGSLCRPPPGLQSNMS